MWGPWLGGHGFKLGFPEGAYPEGASSVGDLGGCHISVTPVSGVAGQPVGKAGPWEGAWHRQPLKPEALVQSVPPPLLDQSPFYRTHAPV